jgi:peptidoglycan/xylan/chitin deacetylase (PgdA/CDA1 family)
MQCNRLSLRFVQRANRLRYAAGALVAGLSLAAANPVFARLSGVRPGGVMDSAEAAVQQIQSGDTAAAAVTLRQALDAEPGNTLLHNMAASLLVMTGDPAGASAEWTRVLQDSPGDSLALYGLGLTSLYRGDRARALDRFQVAGKSGDRMACLLAARYVEILDGAQGGAAGLALPDSFAATARGISGMAAAKTGNQKRALADLSAAIAALPGDPFQEPMGLVMTFRKQTPLVAGSIPLPAGNGLAEHRGPTGEKTFSGTVTLKPDNVDSDTGFVTFKIDGNVSSIANTSPFSLVWNTARVPNGLHKVEMVVYDRQGQEVTRAAKELRTSNANAPSATPRDPALEARVDSVRTALWRSLLLLPSRRALAGAAAEAAKAIHEKESEAQFTSLAAALDPETAGARTKWLAELGCVASPPFYRGAPTENTIALTFDDGPKPGVTELLVNVLKQENIPATFFVIGRHAAECPNLIKLIADAGFEIENHTYTHANLTLLSRASVERELLKTIAAVQMETGRRMRYFRPPGGNLNAEVTKVAAQWGLTPCMWTVTADSLEYGNGNQLVEFVLKHAQPGGVIILHNGRMTTIEALPRIIAGLRQRGYSFATVEQLAQRKAALAHAMAAAPVGGVPP